MDLRNNYDEIPIEKGTTQDKKYQILKSFEVPFSKRLKVSNTRRPVPFIKGKCRIPKKYEDESLYGWNDKGHLMDKLTGEVLISNIKVLDKPRYKNISGQAIYNGASSRFARAKMIKALHDEFKKYIKDIDSLRDIKYYPLGLYLTFKVHDLGNKRNTDNDNRWVWEKAIQDTFVQEGIIPDDNPYVVWENVKRTILIPEEREETLLIEVYGYA